MGLAALLPSAARAELDTTYYELVEDDSLPCSINVGNLGDYFVGIFFGDGEYARASAGTYYDYESGMPDTLGPPVDSEFFLEVCGVSNAVISHNDGADKTIETDTDFSITFSGIPHNSMVRQTWTFAIPLVNQAPVAYAGPDQVVTSGAAVTLDGSGTSDSDGDDLTYDWVQTGGPSVVLLRDSSDPEASFVAPVLLPEDEPVELEFTLTASDGSKESEPDVVTITVTAPVNDGPSADAGPDQVVDSGVEVQLDGSGSSDAEGDPLTYAWVQELGPEVTLDDSSSATPVFTAPEVEDTESERLIFALTVSDGRDRAIDRVAIVVQGDAVIVTPPPTDTDAPTVTLSGAPESLNGSEAFTVRVAFSEPVTGFTEGDVTLSGGQITALTGAGASYAIRVKPAGGSDVTLAIPADAAEDAAGNGNIASTALVVVYTSVDETEAAIATEVEMHQRALIAVQPDLASVFRGGPGGANASVTRGALSFDLATGTNSLLWLRAEGFRQENGGAETSYANATLGANLYRTDNLLLGLMAQADSFEGVSGGIELSGEGWLAGPFAVYQLPSHPLLFTGSYLAGKAETEVTGGAAGSYDSTRQLVTFGATGELAYPRISLFPAVDYVRSSEAWDGYTSTGGAAVSGGEVVVEELSAGFSFEMPLGTAELTLTGGLSGIASRTASPAGDSEGAELGAELGLRKTWTNGSALSLNLFERGLGDAGFGDAGFGYGGSVMLELTF
ncbi:PKD domain-containing protein [Pseudoroseicyclus sp. CXY001]|uniref:PKD domain-containing protein n=1 Tax=Pseudoroseicyclus sp. CXY001 TaxID=3242492 RepID=UPI003570BEEE